MTKIIFAFDGFPLFEGRRPVLASGEAECEALSIGPDAVGELGAVRWRVNCVTLHTGTKGKTQIDLSRNEWLRQDFDRWLRGRHQHTIERKLKQEARATAAVESEGETASHE